MPGVVIVIWPIDLRWQWVLALATKEWHPEVIHTTPQHHITTTVYDPSEAHQYLEYAALCIVSKPNTPSFMKA